MKFEEGFEMVMIFIFLFLVFSSLFWLLLGNHQVPVKPIIAVVFGLLSSGVVVWYLYK